MSRLIKATLTFLIFFSVVAVSAVSAPLAPASASADPQTCIGVWIKLGQDLVDAGYARHGGIKWQGNSPVMVESAISPAACPTLIAAARKLSTVGCNIDREAEVTGAQSQQSDAQYRACQSRFRDTFDRDCYSYHVFDQQVSGRHLRILEVRAWLSTCLAQ